MQGELLCYLLPNKKSYVNHWTPPVRRTGFPPKMEFAWKGFHAVQFNYICDLSVRFRSTNPVRVVSLLYHFSVGWMYSHAAPLCNTVKASNLFTPTPFFSTTSFCFFSLFSLQLTVYDVKLSLTVPFFFAFALHYNLQHRLDTHNPNSLPLPHTHNPQLSLTYIHYSTLLHSRSQLSSFTVWIPCKERISLPTLHTQWTKGQEAH